MATTLTFTGCAPNCPLPCLPTNTCVLVGRLGIGPAWWTNLSGCPPKCGTRVSRWNGTGYSNYDYVNGNWSPQEPVLGIGESAFVCLLANTNCCLPPPSGMSAWWPFDETAGPIANDIAGFNNQGTYLGSPTPTAGMVSNALCFNGTSDYVLVTNHPEINFSGSCTNGTNTAQSFTIDAWIRANANGASTETLLDKRVNPQLW